jgi:Domain of unknown function (DUF1707)
VTEPLRPEDMRVSDVDRKHTQDRLHRAHAEGLISLEEFDSRVHAAWQAKTRGELAKVSADLPARSTTRTPRGAFAPNRGGTAMRVLFTVWLGVSVVNLMIWGLVVLSIGEWVYPWWLWVTVPPGAVLITLWVIGIGRRRE